MTAIQKHRTARCINTSLGQSQWHEITATYAPMYWEQQDEHNCWHAAEDR